MPRSPDDIGNAADDLKSLLSRIEEEKSTPVEKTERTAAVRTGTDEEILPEGIDVKSGTRIDEYCILSTDKDFIYAVLTILPHRPEDYELPVKRILAEMNRIGIRSGIRKANIEKAIQLGRSERQSRIDLVVAQGRRPVHGTDTELTFSWSTDLGKPVVEKGDLLVEKHPGKLAVDGCNILGRALPARRGDETTIIPGQGVIRSKDGLQFYAKYEGIVRWDDGRIWVEPEDRDGYITTEVSADLLSAAMSLYPPSGKGQALDVTTVTQALFEQGITYGIKREVITDTLKRVSKTGEPVLDVPVAQGRPGKQGKDGRLDIVVDFQSKVDRYSINADGTVDFFKLRRIDSVHEGQLLARIVPHTVGREGCTVTGKELPGVEGKPADVCLGDNVILSEDVTEVRAGISGQIHVENDKISVLPVHVVDGDIDYSTGNLEFVGDLVIRGSVLDGFEIRADGNITVEGTVGSSVVRAGGNVHVGQGVFGKQRGTIRARGDVSASFLQNATVYAGGDLQVGNQILNSLAVARGKVIVMSGKGSIVGGRVQGGKGVQADIIGSDFGTKTEVISGVDWEIEEKSKLLHEQIERLQENLTKLDAVTHQYLQLLQGRIQDKTTKLSLAERELITQALDKRKAMENELVRRETEERKNRQKILLPLPADIIARSILHVDVRCTVRDANLRVRKPEKCARVSYNKTSGKLVISPYIA